MGDEVKRIYNPLLQPSVTGATIEEFSQNAVLFPAAEIPLNPPPNLIQELNTPHTQAETSNSNAENLFPQSQESLIASYDTLEITTGFPPYGQPFLHQTQQVDNNNQPKLQSVFSSFTSYLKIGQKNPDKPPSPIPSVVDNFIPQTVQKVDVPPIPLYSPEENINKPLITSSDLSLIAPQFTQSTPTVSGQVNNYRRQTLKRPTYAPIPGLSSNLPSLATSPIAPPITAHNLPLIPPKATIPVSFPGRTSPIKNPFYNSQTYFQPELSGYATPPQSQLIQRPTSPILPLVQPISLKYPSIQKASSPNTPFLEPVNPSDIDLNPSRVPSTTGSLFPTSMSSSDGRVSPIRSTNYMAQGDLDRRMFAGADGQPQTYRPVYNHWFYKRDNDGKEIWNPFSMVDSLNLDTEYLSNDVTPNKVVATDGGRYDVNILRRERIPVYWTGKPNEVRRCSWFHKGSIDGRYVPYEENIANMLEEEFKTAYESNTWNRKVELPSGETVVFHGPDVLVLFPQAQSPDAWSNAPNQPRPRVVKRGMDEFNIDEGEPAKVDHLLFLVHGIGSVCDLKFRSVEEVVDEFRCISLQLVQSHYRSSCEKGMANRVEVLPISWHEKLHSEDTGVDKKLKGITLESIPRLRDFTNDTILDVLFYTSPVYCQTIISCVGNELNRIFSVFKQRNPNFNGGVSLGGHSLGSLILFDILCHQISGNDHGDKQDDQEDDDVVSPLKPHPSERKISRRISYMMSTIGTGQPQLNYPQLSFSPKHFFALGSPIGMFVTVRGLDTLGEHFSLPTCPAFFNIFHPYDPVAYRVESLVNPELAKLKPVLIAHHKGRKRMHLELKETMARVGADLKQRLVDSMKSTWNSFYQFTLFKSQTSPPNLEEEVDKVIEEQINREQSKQDQQDEVVEAEPTDLSLGTLNQGRRIDYVLQEAPLEFFNEYIFALTSHVCYWESEDTMLLILKEIYNSMNITTDNQIPQQSMTIERPARNSGGEEMYSEARHAAYLDPTLPFVPKPDIGPPPMAGFVRKS